MSTQVRVHVSLKPRSRKPPAIVINDSKLLEHALSHMQENVTELESEIESWRRDCNYVQSLYDFNRVRYLAYRSAGVPYPMISPTGAVSSPGLPHLLGSPVGPRQLCPPTPSSSSSLFFSTSEGFDRDDADSCLDIDCPISPLSSYSIGCRSLDTNEIHKEYLQF